jgi:integrase
MSPRRKTLFKYGRRGDQVRGKLDTRRNRIEVYYRDLEGVEHKRIFSNDKEGKAEAAAWAETYHSTRAQMANEAKAPEKRAPLTVRELWEKFVASPAYTKDIRRATQINYVGRWKKWEVFMKPEAIVNETTLDDVDRFRAACDAAGIAINSVRQILNVVRTIYNWGQSRKLITQNELALFKWKTPKDAEILEPGEFTSIEYEALLRTFKPWQLMDGSLFAAKNWRPWVALMILGHHGMRFRAVRHLREIDLDWDAGVVRWPGEFQKQGKDVEQPITHALLSALIVARYWRDRHAPDSPWILFAERKKDEPYSYSSFQYQLVEAEKDAEIPDGNGGTKKGIEHQAYRAAHGFRRMVVGNLLDATGDLMTAMNYVGDIDLKQAKSYDRRMQQRIEKASASIEEAR